MKLLDRYLLRNFFEPFLICFFGFLSIWLVFDLADNGPDFIEAHASIKQVAFYYLTQIPQIVLISLPVGLLLALLFSLSRMSRSNEIISMLTAGRSLQRIMVPFVIVGTLLSGLFAWLNYEAAPHAEGGKKAALELITRSRKSGEKGLIEGYLFRDRMNSRTWFIKKLRPNSPAMENVHITQHDAEGAITKKWYAKRAVFDAKARSWTLERGLEFNFNAAGDVEKREDFLTSARTMTDWTETPKRIASAQFEAQNLSVPELRDYLRFNSDFPEVQLAPYRAYLWHRWAFSAQCFVVVFFAVPLAIVFSRRGVVGGVAAAIFLYAGLLLSTYLFLALGKGSRLSAPTAAWLPSGIFIFIGMVLVYCKATNRDLPTLSFKKK